jgi:hypothetical protein
LDPTFVNPTGNDFHLTDYARPQGAGRDVGAFEYKP